MGQTVSSTSYATAVALSAFSEAAIDAAVGTGDAIEGSGLALRLRPCRPPDLRTPSGHSGGEQRKYQVGAQQFDAFGRVVGSTTYATAVAVNAFDRLRSTPQSARLPTGTKDRASAAAYDALDQMVYNVRLLGPGLHQVSQQEYDALGRVVQDDAVREAVGPLANFDRATIDAAVNAVAACERPQGAVRL